MAYAPLWLEGTDPRVAAVVSLASEGHLRQAHYLLAATYAHEPHAHFGLSAATMTLLSIAAVSSLRRFDLKKNRNAGGDRTSFIDCVKRFFPWEHVHIEDDQGRKQELPGIAATQLYETIRNPLIHAGGIVARAYPKVAVSHPLPGLSTFEENENSISGLCDRPTLGGQTLLEMGSGRVVVHTHPLYWCTRRAIEKFATDPAVQVDIIDSFGLS